MENKKRSLAQRIGETGEAIVRLWATKNQLSANKIDNDYGFDFIFQHFDNHGKHQMHTGIWFLGQCKATEQTDIKYILIDREDAALYLTLNSPFCLISVDNNNEEVKFWFNSRKMIDVLISFVDSSNETLSLNIEKYFDETNNLQNQIKKCTNIAYFQELKIYLLQKLFSKISPKIGFTQIINNGITILQFDSQWITNIINPDYLFINRKNIDIQNIIDVDILNILKNHYYHFDSLAVSGFLGKESCLAAEQEKYSTKAIVYPHKNLISYRLSCGLIINAGPCINKNGQHYHELSFEVKPSRFGIINCFSDCEFFSKVIELNELYIDKHKLVDNLKNWESLFSFMHTMSQIYKAHQKKIFDFSNIKAYDLNNKTYFDNIITLANLINCNNIFTGFHFEDVTDEKLDELEKIQLSGKIPFAIQLKEKKYLLLATSDFFWLKSKKINSIIGIEIKKIKSIELKDITSLDVIIEIPQVWLIEGWPALPLGKDNLISVTFNSIKYPFYIIEDK